MKVAIVGGTGFVGSYLLDELVAEGHTPRLLVRPGSEAKVRHRERCELVAGEVAQGGPLGACLEACDAAVYLIGILREGEGATFEALQFDGARRCIDLARSLGVGRFLLMSANGVKPYGTPYQATKYRAEQHLIGSGLDWTIFRPSVIFGDPRGRSEFATQLYRQMIIPPLPAPLFYEGLLPADAGSFPMSPVHCRDVARAFARALARPETFKQTYALGGPEALPWRTILKRIADAAGVRKLMLPVPVTGVKVLAAWLDRFEAFPVTRDQLTMLMEGNRCDSGGLFELLGISPVRFDSESLAYLRRR